MLKVAGVPYFSKASCNTSKQEPTSHCPGKSPRENLSTEEVYDNCIIDHLAPKLYVSDIRCPDLIHIPDLPVPKKVWVLPIALP